MSAVEKSTGDDKNANYIPHQLLKQRVLPLKYVWFLMRPAKRRPASRSMTYCQ